MVKDRAAVAGVGASFASENRAALGLALSTVGELMASNVVTLDAAQTRREASALFAVRRFRHLPVTEGRRLIGILADRDVFGLLAERPDAGATAVSAVMNPDPITIGPDASVASAISVLLHRRIHCLPVVTDDRILEGLLTTTDVLRALYALQTWLERAAGR